MIDEPQDLALIHAAGWPLPKEIWTSLSQPERSFLLQEFGGGRTVEYYERRLRALGMSNTQLVVDAGCGAGQWSLAAGNLNLKVIGVDKSATRLLVARALADQMDASNVSFVQGGIDEMPILAGAAEAVLCYGTLSLGVRVPGALSEFHRILAPGGVLYCNVNDWGWYAHLMFDRALRGQRYELIIPVVKYSLRTLLSRDSGRVMSAAWLSRRLVKAGFEVLHAGPEGSSRIDGAVNPPPAAYRPTMYGLSSVVEAVARRVG